MVRITGKGCCLCPAVKASLLSTPSTTWKICSATLLAEANHTVDTKLRRELDALFDRLFRTQRSYEDANWNDSAI